MLSLLPTRISGLSDLAARYDAILCDVWGVLHDGVRPYAGAPEALAAYRRGGGRVLLMTNAPRPAAPIVAQLARIGICAEAYDDVVTSGDVTRDLLMSRPERRIAHIGPSHDLTLFQGLPHRLVDDREAQAVVVTGLVDDLREGPDDYRARLAGLAARRLPMVCANPDLLIVSGGRRVWCAGALARLYQDDFGGLVVQAGKPHGPIYDEARLRLAALAGRPLDPRRVLVIGDGLATDLRGAMAQGFDALFVTGGIHAAEFGPVEAPDRRTVERRLVGEGVRAVAMLPHLVW